MFIVNARKSFIFFVAVLLLLVSSGLLLRNGFVELVFAAPNYEINYQGKLTDNLGSPVADGTYNIRFFLYTVPTGGSAVFSETASTSVTSGLFSYMIGSSTDISGVNFDQTLYLGVEIGGTGSPSWDGEMSPRKILGTVPSAFEARQLGGLGTTSFLRADQADTATGLITFEGGASTTDIVVSGTTTATNLAINNSVTLSSHTNGLLVTNNSGVVSASSSLSDAFIADTLTIGAGSTFANDLITPNAVQSSGQSDEYCLTYETTGTTWEWQDCAGSIANDSLDWTEFSDTMTLDATTTIAMAHALNFDSGTFYIDGQNDRVGIGTTTLTRLLSLADPTNPGIRITDSTNNVALDMRAENFQGFIGTFSNNDLRLVTDNTSRVTIDTNGDVGIGTTSPASRLDIWGDFRVGTSGTPTLFVDASTDRVGIGTLSPTEKLHVEVNDNTGYAVYAQNLNGTTGDKAAVAGLSIMTGQALDTAGYLGGFNVSENEWFGIQGTTRNATAILGQVLNAGSGYAGIFTGGNVGIGTTSPFTTFTVDGDTMIAGALYDNNYDAGTNGFILQSTGSGIDWVATSTLGLTGSSIADDSLDWAQFSDSMTLDATTTIAMAHALNFDSGTFYIDGQNDRVGVGSSTPGSTLSVGGDFNVGLVGATSLFVDQDTRQVGIRTNDPQYPLGVLGDARINGSLLVSQNGLSAANFATIDHDNQDLTISTTNGTGNIILSPTGNVGIGTSSPSALLDIAGSVGSVEFPSSGSNIQFTRDGANYIDAVAGSSANLNLRSTGNQYFRTNDVNRLTILNTGLIGIGDDNADFGLEIVASSSNGFFAISDRPDNDGDLFVVDASGNVGIGTSSPSAELDVIGDIQAGANGLILISEDGNGGLIQGQGVGNLTLRGGSGPYLTFSNGGGINIGPTAILNLAANGSALNVQGSVGIGTTSPSALLTVGSSTQDAIPANELYNSVFIAGSLELDGALYDSSNSAGTNGFILQSTGSGIDWVATSTLGLGAGSIADDSLDWAQFTDTMTLDATTTIAMAHALNFDSDTLFIDGQDDRVGIGTDDPQTTLQVVGTSNLRLGTATEYITFLQRGPNRWGWLSDDSNYLTTWNFDDGVVEIDGSVGIGTSSPVSLLDVYGDFRVGTSGTPTLFVDASTDRVGIGTTAPAHLLDVPGSSNTNIAHMGNINISTDGSNYGRIVEESGWFAFRPSNSFVAGVSGQFGVGSTTPYAKLSVLNTDGTPSFIVQDETNDTSPFVIDASGNVGIGTSSPVTFKLQVRGDIGPDSDSTYDLGEESNRFNIAFLRTIDSGANSLVYESNIDHRFTINGSEEIRLNATGLGIGTTSPASLLDVYGDFQVGTSGTPTLFVDVSTNRVGISTSTPQARFSILNTESIDSFRVNDALGDATPFVIDESGMVGIGNASPQLALDVRRDSTGLANTTYANYGLVVSHTPSNGLALGDFSTYKAIQSFGTTPLALNPAANNVGVGTTSPFTTFTVDGDTMLTGALYDNNYDAGTNGFILQSTGTGIDWVATSTLGLGAGSIADDSLDWAQFTDTMTLDATTTIAMAHALNFDSGTFYIDGQNDRVGIGTTSPQNQLHIGTPSDLNTLIQLDAHQPATAHGIFLSNSAGSQWVIGRGSSRPSTNGIGFKDEDNSEFPLWVEDGADSSSLYVTDTSPVGLGGGNGSVIGIGTSTPFAKLHVLNETVADTFRIDDELGDTSPFIIDASGNVGIGTSSPDYPFDLAQDVNGSALVGRIFNTSGVTTDNDATLQLTTTGAAGGDSYVTYNNIGNYVWYTGVDNSDSDKFKIAVGSMLGTGDVLTIDTPGNVGIGTTSPLSELHLANSDVGILLVEDTDDTYLQLVAHSGGPETNSLMFSNTGIFNISSQDPAAKGSASSDTQRLTVVGSTGNIGIATTSPASTLDVWGDFRVGTSGTSTLFVDTSTNRVGVGTTNPSALFEAAGRILSSPSTPVKVGGTSTDAAASDIFVRGDYAYLTSESTGDDLEIFNISDPTNPVEVGSVEAGNGATAVQVVGDYAYVTSGSVEDFKIFDISNPTNPVKVSGVGTDDSADDVKISGHYAYVVSSDVNDDLEVFDISDPTNPVKVGGVSTADNVNDIIVRGNYAYLGLDFQAGDEIEIFDISDPTNMVKVGGAAGPQNIRGMALSGQYLYTVGSSATNEFRIFDVSDPTNPTEVGAAETGGTAYEVTIAGDYAYVAGSTGFRVFDVSSSTNPTQIALVALDDVGRSIAVSGNYAYVTSNTTGDDIEIFDLGGIQSPTGEIGSLLAHRIDTGELLAETANFSTGLNVGQNAQINGVLSITGTASTSLLTSNTNPALIVQSGYVGVGTTTPGYDLTVDGSTMLAGALYDNTYSAGTNGYILQTTGSGVQWVATSTLGLGAGSIADDSLDWAQFTDTMTLDATTTIAMDHALNFDSGTLYIDGQNDRVGIGTANPVEALQVEGTGTAGPSFLISRDGFNHGMSSWTTDVDTQWSFGSWNGANSGALAYGYSNAASVAGMSLVGVIGDSSPTAGVAAVELIGLKRGGVTTQNLADSDTLFEVSNQSSSAPRLSLLGDGRLGLFDTSPDYGLEIHSSSSNGYFGISSLAGNDGDVFTVDASGNVGIGTSSPASALHVANGLTMLKGESTFNDLDYSGDFTHQLYIGNSSDDNTVTDNQGILLGTGGFGNNPMIRMRASGGSLGYLGWNNSETDFHINVVNNSRPFHIKTDGTERLTVLSSGNVGIGTTSPTTLLTVGSSTPGAIPAGEQYNSAFIAGSLELDGALYDGSDSAGTSGMVLQTTGSGVTWVATSSLGIGGTDTNSDTATYIVAATSSTNASDADYIADGTNDEATIQAAIDALPAEGGIVHLLEGFYGIEGQIDIDREGVVLQGSGPGTVLRVATGTNGTFDVIDHLTGAGNTVIRDLTIDGNKAGQTSGNMYGIRYTQDGATSTIQNVIIKNTHNSSIYIDDDYYNILIDRVTITNDGDTNDHAVYIDAQNFDGITISNSTFDNVGSAVLTTNTSGTQLKVVDNHFTRLNRSGVELSGTVSPSITDVVIANNTFDTQGLNSGTVISAGQRVERVTVANNIIKGSAHHAISLASSYSSIIGNTIDETVGGLSGDGINVTSAGRHVLIANNNIGTTTNAGDGIDVAGDYITITGNTIVATDDEGIRIVSADNVVASENVVRNAGIRGVVISSVNNFSFNNNVIVDSSNTAIEVTSSAYGTINDNQIDEVGATADDGISIATSNDIVVSNNHIYDASGSTYGIDLASTALRTHLDGNVIVGAGWTNPINDDGGSTTYLQNNRGAIVADTADFQDGAYTAFSVTQLGTGNILDLVDADGSSTTTVLTVLDGGNVGIGTTTDLNARLTIQSSTTDNILDLVETNGSTVLSVSESGNLGLGTSTPQYPIEILTSNSTYGISVTNSASAAQTIYGYHSGGGAGIGVHGETVGNSSSIGILGQASNGIGVYGSSNSGVSGYFVSSDGFNTEPTLLLQRAGDATGNLLEVRDDVGNILTRLTSTGYLNIGTTTTNARLTVQSTTTNDILNLFETSGSEVFTVLESGNVGIGTSSPYADLSIAGDVAITGGIYDNSASLGTNGYVLQSTGSGVTWVATSTLGLGGGSSVSFGSDNQIPFTNSGGTDFDYSSGFTFDGSDLTLGHLQVISEDRTMPTTVNDTVDIGTFGTEHAHSLRMTIAVSSASFSVAKSYVLASSYNEATGWRIVPPISDSGPYSSNDFQLEARQVNADLEFRIRRTSGSTAGTARVTITHEGESGTVFTASSATASGVTAVTQLYPTALLTQVDGNIGIGTTSPAAFIDVWGDLMVGNSGTPSLFVDVSSDYVGIATSAPAYNLAIDGDALITGALYDNSYSAGTNGMILQTTGTGLSWVATSSLGVLQSNSNVATYIVAASSSVGSTSADYVADGTDDQDTIQSAINALPAEGGIIYLLEGTYHIADDIDITSPNVTITGGGPATILKVPDSTSGNVDVFLFGSGSDNSVIRDLAIDGNKAGITSGNMHAIRYGAAGATSTIYNVSIKDMTDSGIYIGQNFSHVTIDSVTVSNNGDAGDLGVEITDGNSNHISITNSTFINVESGVGHGGTGAGATHYLVSHNQFIDNTGRAIEFNRGEDIVISNNVIESSSGSGIYASDNTSRVTIADNQIYGGNGDGIEILADNSSVTGNILRDIGDGTNDFGILVNDASDVLVANNHIATTTDDGILVADGSNITITGNQVLNSQEDGIELYDTAVFTISDNLISTSTVIGINVYNGRNGKISDNVISEVGTGDDGIALSNMDDVVISGNMLYDSVGSDDGISITSSAARTYLADNIIRGAGWDDLYRDAGINTSFLQDNRGTIVADGTDFAGGDYTAFSITQVGGGNLLDLIDADGSSTSTVVTVLDDGFMGLGATTPGARLTIGSSTISALTSGELYNSLFVSGSLELDGAFYDASDSAGTAGFVLQSTGTSTEWVATSTLGLGGGSSVSFGSDNQIPYTNSGGTDFDYSGNFTFDGSLLTVTGDIHPGTSLTYDLGSSTARWDNLWAQTLNVGTSTWSIFATSTGALTFNNAAEQGGAEYFSIHASGTETIIGKDTTGNLLLETAGDTFITLSESDNGINFNKNPGITLGSGDAVLTFDSGGEFFMAGYDESDDQFAISDSFDFSVDANHRFVIESGGNVGVGTNTPASLLDVWGDLRVGTSSNPAFIVDVSTDRVGIGTSSPQARLTIAPTGLAQTWTQVGNDLNLSPISGPVLAALTPNRVALQDEGGNLEVYEFDGTSWSQVGTGLYPGVGTYSRITALSPNRIAYFSVSDDDLRVYEFDGNSWSQVGNDLNISGVTVPTDMAALTPNRIAFHDNEAEELRVYEFDGTDWFQVGNDFSISGTGFYVALTALSPNRVVFIDSSADELTTYEFDGTTWSQVGNALTLSSTADFPTMTTLAPNRIAYIDGGDDELTVYEFDGTNWSQVGSSFATQGSATQRGLAALSPNRIAYINNGEDDLRTYQFAAPLLAAVDGNDMPLFSVADTGVVTIGGSVGTTTAGAINFGSQSWVTLTNEYATNTDSTASLQAAFHNESIFLDRVGIGTTSPSSALTINGAITLSSTTPSVTTNALYNVGGTLYFDGSPVGGGTFGTDSQIPFTNTGGTDFQYEAAFSYNETTDALTIGGMTLSDALTTHTVVSTTTVPNNEAFAWTIATSTTGTPLFRIDTTSGNEAITIGEAGGDVFIGAVGSASNLIFEESSTIHGQAGNVITLGQYGDIFNVNSFFGFGSSSPSQPLAIATSTVITGTIYDQNYSAGTAGYVLQTTGSGVEWVVNDASPFTNTGSTTYLTAQQDRLSVGTTSAFARFNISTENLSSSWTQIGSDTAVTDNGYAGMARLSPIRFAYLDAGNGELRTYEFNGSTWSQVGSALNLGGSISSPVLAGLSNNRIAFTDEGDDEIRTYEFDGSTWSQIGNSLSIAGSNATDPALTALSHNRVVYLDDNNNDLRVYEFDGTDWAQVGTDFNISPVSFPTITNLAPNRIAFIEEGDDDLRVYEFDGTTWTQIGNDYNVSGEVDPTITTLSPNRIAFLDDSNEDLRVYEFNGTNWSEYGTELNVGSIEDPTIEALTPNRIVFIDNDGDVLRTYQFAEPAVYVGSDAGFQYFSISDAGHAAIESATINAGLTVNAAATGTNAINGTTSPALVVNGRSHFTGDIDVVSDFSVGTSSTPTLFVDVSTNRLGIGTDSPLANFQVNGSVWFNGGSNSIDIQGDDIEFVDNGNDGSYYVSMGNAGIDDYNLGTVDGHKVTILADQGTRRHAIVSAQANSAGDTIFGISGSVDSGSSYDPYLVIESDGSIGIGTSSPASKLDVWGDFRVGTSGTPALFVDASTDNVGIGTTTPNYGLTIDGALMLAGALYDSSYSAGSAGMVLQSTGNGIQWVATSSLGLGLDSEGHLFAVYSTSTQGTSSVNFGGAADSAPSFSAGVLTLPSNTSHIVVELWGAGAGGGGSANGSANNGTGGAGGDTCFASGATPCDSTNTIATSTGAAAGANGRSPGTPGTGIGGDINLTGGGGDSGSFDDREGSQGGSAPLGGGGGRGSYAGQGEVGAPFGGGGAGTGYGTSGGFSGNGGSAGGYAYKLIETPSGTYSFEVGAGGAAGAAGSGGVVGRAGGDGGVVIRVYTSQGGADLAELYPVDDHSISAADIVYFKTESPIVVDKAVEGSEKPLAGVVSTDPGIVLSDGTEGVHSRAVALAGRVPVKVNLEGGPIFPGDRIAPSSVPGIGRKAGAFEPNVGIAITEFTGDDDITIGYVTVFVDLQEGFDTTHLTNILFGSTTAAFASTSSSTLLSEFSPQNQNDTIWSRLYALAVNFVDGVLSVAGLKTNEICLSDAGGETCIDRATLNALINNSAQQATQNNTSSTTTSTEETEAPPVDPEPEPEPEVIPSEPVSTTTATSTEPANDEPIETEQANTTPTTTESVEETDPITEEGTEEVIDPESEPEVATENPTESESEPESTEPELLIEPGTVVEEPEPVSELEPQADPEPEA